MVTGGGSGIGAATALEFATEGAKVVVIDRDNTAGEAQRERLRSDGFDVCYIDADVGFAEDCRRSVGDALEAFGRIDVLVNNAASFISAGRTSTTADWARISEVNVAGAANMVQVALAPLQRSPHGAIVNVASVSAYIAQRENWTYNATKAAILSLTRSIAMDFARYGIRVNSVSPGWIWTPPAAALVGDDRRKFEQHIGKLHLLGRSGDPREVARAILFLCSDDASFVTGTDLRVDGGYLAMGPERSEATIDVLKEGN